MATETGTATGFIDLYTKLIAFATTSLGSENWSVVHGYEKDDDSIVGTPTLLTQNVYDNKVILKGTGSGGTDEIYVGLQTNYDSDVQKYTLAIQGLNAFDNTKLYNQQATFSSACYSYAWDMSMAYWFAGDGRRIIAVFRMGTIYQIMYLGLFLPYATTTDYPYPLLVGGCGISPELTTASTSGNDFFIDGRNGSGSLYAPSNAFYKTGNYDSSGDYPTGGDQSIYFLPYNAGIDGRSRLRYIREALGGCYVLTPIEILANGEYGLTGILGLVDGIYHVSGFGNYSENVITVNSVDYIVFQRVYRTTVDAYIAIRWQ